MKYKLSLLLLLIPIFSGDDARANWQYPGEYVGGGYYSDDGARFILSLRGGASIAQGSIKNEIGTLSSNYYIYDSTGEIVSELGRNSCISGGSCVAGDFTAAGYGEIADLPAVKDFENVAFATGVSIGWVIPNKPQLRMELGWDHIMEAEYNQSPLFQGDTVLSGGTTISNNASGGVNSSVTTDVLSAMIFYDFFSGIQKDINEVIPYVGFGFGFADSTTTLVLSDLYGDLSTSLDLQNYGTLDDYDVLQFNKSEKTNSNIAGLLSLGFSYGITEHMFLDLGVRFTYIPKIKWVISDDDAEKSRDWFSANDVIYSNIMVGIRFEF